MKIYKMILFLAILFSFTSCNKEEILQEEEIVEEPKEETAVETKEYIIYEGEFELPVNGATGFTTLESEIFKEASTESESLGNIPGGRPFEILEETEDYWKIRYESQEGFIKNTYCLINLPDVVPSIAYDGINTYASKDRSLGKEIPGVTGELIYPGTDYNERFDQERFIIPILYPTAKKIRKIQQEALKNGETLIVYEGYRPLSAQEVMVRGLMDLAAKDPEVNKAISTPPWSIDWFAGSGVSNHQYGYAVDLSLAIVKDSRVAYTGDYQYTEVTIRSDLPMPTAVNELSTRSIVFTAPVDPASPDVWKTAKLAPTMNDNAIRLQNYCTQHGLTPLASEWWHFNDIEEENKMINTSFSGEYVYKSLRSKPAMKQ